MTRETFARSMATLQKLYGYQIEADVMRFYWSAVANMADTDFVRTIDAIVSTFHPTSQCPFPVPADFVRASGVSLQDRARNVIGLIKHAIASCGAYDSVSFGDDALHGVIVRFGGWGTLCSWGDREWGMNQRAIIEAYESAARAGVGGPKYLPGIIETENSGKYPEHIPPVKLITTNQGRYAVEEKRREQIGVVVTKQIAANGDLVPTSELISKIAQANQ